MWVLKVLAFLWPFLKELVLGKKTVKQAIKTNKWKVFLLCLISTSFVVNLLAVPRLLAIANDYVKLNKKYEMQVDLISKSNKKIIELEAQLKASRLSNNGNPNSDTVVIRGKRVPKSNLHIEKDSIKKRFDEIKQKESN